VYLFIHPCYWVFELVLDRQALHNLGHATSPQIAAFKLSGVIIVGIVSE
jgi:hypothetical protein